MFGIWGLVLAFVVGGLIGILVMCLIFMAGGGYDRPG
jgi:hypothetical protein